MATWIFHTVFLPRGPLELGILIGIRLITGLKAQLIVIDHDPRHLYQRSTIACLLYAMLIRCADRLVLIGENTYTMYEKCLPFVPLCHIESPFLLPDTYEQDLLFTAYPISLQKTVQLQKPIICMNASGYTFFQGKDLYGFDVTCRLMKNSIPLFPTAHLIIVCSGISLAQENALHALINANGITSHTTLLSGSYHLWPLFPYVTLFLRPTRSDSYGMSIAEALHFNVPTIASDVCKRPNGTILYPVDDELALFKKTIRVLQESAYDSLQHAHASAPAVENQQ
jgi:hypothetical protein